jgi:hypothetical protein
MNEEKTPDGQVSRLRRTVLASQIELTQPGSAEVTYDADRDAAVVKVFDLEVFAFGRDKWDMDDDEVNELLVEAWLETYGGER